MNQVREIDFPRVRWGHNLEKVGDSYFCFCTPGPKIGDIAIADDGSRWEFTVVEPQRNPRDLYIVDLKRVDP